jgi:DNA modification methylase
LTDVKLLHGDCLEVMRAMPAESVDAVVTDPPYGLSFMGKRWDYDVPSVEIWQECLRVLKPGGHLLAFAGTRTQHRMCVRIEDAGFEIRDMIAWVYGSGFPKSHDVSKAIDRAAGAEREVVGKSNRRTGPSQAGYNGIGTFKESNWQESNLITAPATAAARQWQGWGTALKPALEPITVARKPLVGTVANNVLRHGTGAINVDGCRVNSTPRTTHAGGNRQGTNPAPMSWGSRTGHAVPGAAGRWPANLIHDGSDEVMGLFPETRARGNVTPTKRSNSAGSWAANGSAFGIGPDGPIDPGDSGSAARFFYCAKASKADRDEGLSSPEVSPGEKTGREDGSAGITPYAGSRAPTRNNHPTVKPTALMRYLVRLVTPPGGVVLDPFMGSGSTGKAAAREGFAFIGIEREENYLEIARARIDSAAR